MSDENKKPENIFASLEAKKGSVAVIIKEAWEQTKRPDVTPAKHFCALHLNLMQLMRIDKALNFNLVLGMLADSLLPILTDEEKEALRNTSTEL